jgi:hypothetical protein
MDALVSNPVYRQDAILEEAIREAPIPEDLQVKCLAALASGSVNVPEIMKSAWEKGVPLLPVAGILAALSLKFARTNFVSFTSQLGSIFANVPRGSEERDTIADFLVYRWLHFIPFFEYSFSDMLRICNSPITKTGLFSWKDWLHFNKAKFPALKVAAKFKP